MESSAFAIISKINQIIINPIIVLLFSIALLYFVYGVLEYLVKSRKDPSAIQTGSKHMGYGLLGMFIMFSVFAFLKVIINTFPIDTETKDNVQRVLPLN